MSKKKKITFEKILSSLDTLWGKLTIIGIMLFAGFKAGCLYEEVVQLRKQHEIEVNQWELWKSQEEIYKSKIDELKRENIELLSRIKELEYIIRYGDEKEAR